MECPRCDGFMVSDRFRDLQDSTGERYFLGSRCVACGEIIDPVILKNREDLELALAY